MNNKRQFERAYLDASDSIDISCPSLKEKAKIIDVSTGGIRVSLSKSLDQGTLTADAFIRVENGSTLTFEGDLNALVSVDGTSILNGMGLLRLSNQRFTLSVGAPNRGFIQ